MGISIKGGTPIAGWFIREDSMKMDDAKGYPYFRKPPYYHQIFLVVDHWR